MKKIMSFILIVLMGDISAMQLIQEIRNWREERAIDDFTKNFAAQTFSQASDEMFLFSPQMKEKIFKKSIKQHPNCLRKGDLFAGVVLLTALPVELQIKVLKRVDKVFSDKEAQNYFLHEKSIKDALRWHAVVDGKLGDRPVYFFEERRLFKNKFSCTLTKQQLLELSGEAALMLERLRDDSPHTRLLRWDHSVSATRPFSKNQLIALQQLIDKKYIRVDGSHERLMEINVEHLFPFCTMNVSVLSMLSVVLPLITSYYAQCILIPTELPLSGQARLANSVLAEQELLGKGPFLKHEILESIYLPATLFKYCLIKLADLAAIWLAYAYCKATKKSYDAKTGFNPLFFFMPACIALIFFGIWVQGRFIRDVKVSEFKPLLLVFFTIIGNLSLVGIESLLNYDPKASSKECISCTEIKEYLNNRWITIK